MAAIRYWIGIGEQNLSRVADSKLKPKTSRRELLRGGVASSKSESQHDTIPFTTSFSTTSATTITYTSPPIWHSSSDSVTTPSGLNTSDDSIGSESTHVSNKTSNSDEKSSNGSVSAPGSHKKRLERSKERIVTVSGDTRPYEVPPSSSPLGRSSELIKRSSSRSAVTHDSDVKEKDKNDHEKRHSKEKETKDKDKEKDKDKHKDKKSKDKLKDKDKTLTFADPSSILFSGADSAVDLKDPKPAKKPKRSTSVGSLKKSHTVERTDTRLVRLEEPQKNPDQVESKFTSALSNGSHERSGSSSGEEIVQSPKLRFVEKDSIAHARTSTAPLSPKRKHLESSGPSPPSTDDTVQHAKSSIDLDGFAIKRRGSRPMSQKITKSKLQIPASTNRTLNGDRLLYSTVTPGYWAEGFIGPHIPANVDNLFAIHDERRDALLFPLQDFTNHYEYHSLFFNVPHVNFIGFDNTIGPILISITQEAFSSDSHSPRKVLSRQVSEKSVKPPGSGASDLFATLRPYNLFSSTSSQSSFPNEAGSLSTVPTASPRDKAPDSSSSSSLHLFLNNEALGSHRALIRTKIGDYSVKIQAIHTKRKYPKGHSLLNALIATQPQVPFDWDKTEFKECHIPKESIMDVELKLKPKHYKFGVIYAKSGQSSDNQFLQNNELTESFERFMNLLGKKIELKGWNGFTGGLDTHHGNTGKYSYFAKFRDYDIMFHVSVLLPHVDGDEQQLEKKRHIGNDVVVIVFQEGDTTIAPSTIKSYFNHVFLIVHPLKPEESSNLSSSSNLNNLHAIGEPISPKPLSKQLAAELPTTEAEGNSPSIQIDVANSAPPPSVLSSRIPHDDEEAQTSTTNFNLSKFTIFPVPAVESHPRTSSIGSEDMAGSSDCQAATPPSPSALGKSKVEPSTPPHKSPINRHSRSSTSASGSSPPAVHTLNSDSSPRDSSPVFKRKQSKDNRRSVTYSRTSFGINALIVSSEPTEISSSSTSVTPRSPRIDDLPAEDQVPATFVDPVTAAAMDVTTNWGTVTNSRTRSPSSSPRLESVPPATVTQSETDTTTTDTLSESGSVFFTGLSGNGEDDIDTADQSTDFNHDNTIDATIDKSFETADPSKRRTLQRRLSHGSNRQLIKSTKSGKLSKALPQIHRAKMNVAAKERITNPPTRYRVEIVSKDGTVASDPKLPAVPVFESGPYFKEFLLTKLINAERAAYFSPHFAKPIERTRELLMQSLIEEHK